MSLRHLPPRLSDAEALALGRLIEPELHAALVTVDAHGADLQLPKVRLGYAGHLQALRWIRREPEPQASSTSECTPPRAIATAAATNGQARSPIPEGATLPSTRQISGSLGAHESWARTPDRTARTAPGRRAFLERFEREVDPDGTLPPEERAKRAENARKAYFARLALKSAKARAGGAVRTDG